MRVFAIANPLFQALVSPLHDRVMLVLRRLPVYKGATSRAVHGTLTHHMLVWYAAWRPWGEVL